MSTKVYSGKSSIAEIVAYPLSSLKYLSIYSCILLANRGSAPMAVSKRWCQNGVFICLPRGVHLCVIEWLKRKLNLVWSCYEYVVIRLSLLECFFLQLTWFLSNWINFSLAKKDALSHEGCFLYNWLDFNQTEWTLFWQQNCGYLFVFEGCFLCNWIDFN